MNLLGIDAGASSSKWAVVSPSLTVLASGRTAPLTGHIFTTQQRQANRLALEQLYAAVQQYQPTRVVAGITGLSRGDVAAQFYQTALLEQFSAAQVMSDMDLAYLAHFKLGQGILVYAGTGGIAYHLAADNSVVRAGGRGYLIADPGGGFSLGQKLLEFVTTQMDLFDTPNHPLCAAVFKQIGSSQWADLRQYVYSTGRSAVAAFAPLLGQDATNPEAMQMLEQAGAEIAMLARRLITRVGVLPIALAGGALEISPIITDSARANLAGLEVRVPKLDLAVMAAKMALGKVS